MAYNEIETTITAPREGQYRTGRFTMPYSRSMTDYDAETTVFRVNTTPISAANFDAQLALQVALGNAINGITLGTLQKIVYGNEITSPGVCNDPLAQRENKWLIRYRDDVTGEPYRLELGTADLTKLDPNNRGFAQMGDGAEVDAFVTAFEAYALSPEGNAVTVTSIQFVGRNT